MHRLPIKEVFTVYEEKTMKPFIDIQRKQNKKHHQKYKQTMEDNFLMIIWVAYRKGSWLDMQKRLGFFLERFSSNKKKFSKNQEKVCLWWKQPPCLTKNIWTTPFDTHDNKESITLTFRQSDNGWNPQKKLLWGQPKQSTKQNKCHSFTALKMKMSKIRPLTLNPARSQCSAATTAVMLRL